MRTPFKGSDYYSLEINSIYKRIEKAYLDAIIPEISMHKTRAMIGDSSISEVETFDPDGVQLFYQHLADMLEGWAFSGISQSTTEDLHRLYCYFTKENTSYHISAYFGIQFHALPYYKIDKRVIEIQMELAKVAEQSLSLSKDIANKADRALKLKLDGMGYNNLETQELFAKMFEDEKLVKELDEHASTIEGQFPQFIAIRNRQNELFSELNSLVVKLYHISPVLIDYNRLMQGEEGATVYFDIETINNKRKFKREANFDSSKILKLEADKVICDLGQILETLQKILQ
jgi:hypothetical protein